jgi:hypothetical protein
MIRHANSIDPRTRSMLPTYMNTAAFFAERRERADFVVFDKIMRRKGGEPPKPEDIVP